MPPNLGIMAIRGEGVTEGFTRDHDSSNDETMSGEGRETEMRKPCAKLIDIVQSD